jgi:hypothetical protein
MTRDEYNLMFHRHQLNLVAFKQLMYCDEEVLKLVNAAIAEEREACAKIADRFSIPMCDSSADDIALLIRARGNT